MLKYFSRKLKSTEIERAIAPYYPPVASPQELNLPPVIEEALQSEKRLFIRYIDRKGDASERWVTPKQVLALNDYIYLVAHCHLRDEERTSASTESSRWKWKSKFPLAAGKPRNRKGCDA